MHITLHKNATPTIAVRQAIQKSALSISARAKKYGISKKTTAERLEAPLKRPRISPPTALSFLAKHCRKTKKQKKFTCLTEYAEKTKSSTAPLHSSIRGQTEW